MILYGLGNNEEKYLKTRHNVGRLILESLATQHAKTWKKTQQVHHTNLENIELIYGDGFMNSSGQQLHSYLDYKHISPDIICVIQDDSDQISGKFKLVKGGGDAGHKGIRDIYRHVLHWGIPVEQIWRIKVGIRPPKNTQRSEAFVLRGLSESEIDHLSAFTKLLQTHLSWFNEEYFGRLQNEINGFHNELLSKNALD